jgi:rhamnosyltransferase
MAERSVLGVVVTYNPGEELPRHLEALRDQLDVLLVVDNGSTNRAWVESVAAQADCRFVGNERNLGIATALNQGLRMAADGGHYWLATFDQDSDCPRGAIAALLAAHAQHPRSTQVAIVSSSHVDRALGRDYAHPTDVLEATEHWRLMRTAITSGNLARVDVLREAGGFDDGLFIDCVDHDLCLRLRRRGWLILEACDVVMPHSIGAASVHRLLGLPVVCTHHSPARRYYQVRNALEVGRRNVLFDPAWVFACLSSTAAAAVAVLLFEPQKARKLGAMARGVLHFMLRRFGALT